MKTQTNTANNLPFYKLEAPTTKQIFDAIICNDYTPLESIKPKAKQIKTLLLDYWDCKEIFVTFSDVTNTGGCPIFFASNVDLYTIATEQLGFYDISDEEQEYLIELLGCYCHTYDEIFN